MCRSSDRSRLVQGALALALAALPAAIVLERLLLGPTASHLAASYVTLSLAAGPASIAVVGIALVAASLGAAFVVAGRAAQGSVTAALAAD